MSDDEFAYREVPTGLPLEMALAIVSTLTNFLPGIGGAVSNVLGGLSVDRKLGRVHEVLEGLANDLCDFKTDAATERYVKSDEFEELLENVLRKAAEERNEERRRLLRTFLVEAIEHPRSYDEQRSLLRLLDEVEPEHMLVLKALAELPQPDEMNGLVGTIIGTLQRRLPSQLHPKIADMVARMTDLRLIQDLDLSRMQTMMTAAGAADLRDTISSTGQRLLAFVKA